MLHFLRINGVEASFDQDDAYDVILRVAAGEAGHAELAQLVAEAIQRAAKQGH
jgi:prophage maintenance system killer protein